MHHKFIIWPQISSLWWKRLSVLKKVNAHPVRAWRHERDSRNKLMDELPAAIGSHYWKQQCASRSLSTQPVCHRKCLQKNQMNRRTCYWWMLSVGRGHICSSLSKKHLYPLPRHRWQGKMANRGDFSHCHGACECGKFRAGWVCIRLKTFHVVCYIGPILNLKSYIDSLAMVFITVGQTECKLRCNCESTCWTWTMEWPNVKSTWK